VCPVGPVGPVGPKLHIVPKLCGAIHPPQSARRIL